MHRRSPAVAGLALGAVLVRLPALFASRHLGFDDGVYGASARVMRDGAVPFRAVFSSQGPLFLPLVWLADALGLRRLDSPRLLAVAAGLGVTLATVGAARAAGLRPARVVLAGALVATSGSVLWVTGPLTSDGVAIAFATAAVAIALHHRKRPTVARAIATGVLVGATLSVKSLLAGVLVPVAWVLLSSGSRRVRDTAAAGVSAVAFGLLAALPFGLGRVWDQSVRYHLDAAGSRTPLANAAKTLSTIASRDLPLVAAIVVAVIAMLAARRRGTRSAETSGIGTPTPTALAGAWLVATAVVLVLEHPLWRNHVAHLVPPLALLIALRPPPPRILAAALALTAPLHLAHLRPVLWPAPYHAPANQAIADLRSLPQGTWSISDEPGLVWRAGRRPPADLVDTSRLRIEEGRITTRSLVQAAANRSVCVVLVWSHRFAGLPGLGDALGAAGFSEGRRYGGRRVLYVKHACQLP